MKSEQGADAAAVAVTATGVAVTAVAATVRVQRDADPAAQAASLAAAVAAALTSAIATRGAASLVVSGGRTPAAMFRLLASQPLDWSRVQITLADERWVGFDHPASNERLVHSELLRGAAAAALLIGMKNEADTPHAGAAQAWQTIAPMPRPFDMVLLGMGDDGHTASLFPGSAELATGLDANAPPGCLGVLPVTAPLPRLSLNLAALLDSRHIALQLVGHQKWQVYEQACAAGDIAAMPVRAILRQQRVSVDVYWCPEALGA
jgi:6-phosphogluconolactonase